MFKENKTLDALFIKHDNEDTVAIYTTEEDGSEEISYNSLNVV